MDRQNSITLQGFTNFLQAGALLRRGQQWTLIEGPFEASERPNTQGISVFWPDFYELENHPFWRGTHSYHLPTSEVQRICETYLQVNKASSSAYDGPLSKASWHEPLKEHFAVALESIQKKIVEGVIKKAVPAVFARSSQQVTPVDLAQMLAALTQAPESLHVYGFWQKDQGVIGATPEVLFDYENHVLKTMALAGTCPKSESVRRESLLKDPKEMQEHQLVVEDLQSRLSGWGQVKTTGPDILELPILFHLKTDFVVSCEHKPDFLELMRELHPTPALGVAPRGAGYKWLAQFPGQEGRRGFGAPFAVIEGDKALCLVGIRNLQWNDKEAVIGSGCGVVAGSELDREWRELFQKRLSVKKVLGLEL